MNYLDLVIFLLLNFNQLSIFFFGTSLLVLKFRLTSCTEAAGIAVAGKVFIRTVSVKYVIGGTDGGVDENFPEKIG